MIIHDSGLLFVGHPVYSLRCGCSVVYDSPPVPASRCSCWIYY